MDKKNIVTQGKSVFSLGFAARAFGLWLTLKIDFPPHARSRKYL